MCLRNKGIQSDALIYFGEIFIIYNIKSWLYLTLSPKQ